MLRFTLILFAAVLLFSCKNEGGSSSQLPDYDLLKHGLPIKIKAPADVKVEVEDYGVMKDITVKGDNNFFLQITSGEATSMDITQIKNKLLEEVKKAPFFEEVVEDYPSGFIFKKKISEEKIKYDFRHIKFQGDQEYIFQTGLIGNFSLEDAKVMLEAVRS